MRSLDNHCSNDPRVPFVYKMSRDSKMHQKQEHPLKDQLGFSYFEFKIRLIRLGLSFQKQKNPVFELTTY